MVTSSRSRSKQLMIDIFKTGGVLTVAIMAPGALPALRPFLKKGKFDRSDFNRTLARLYKNHLISTREQDGQLTIMLEQEGKKKAIRYSIDDITVKKPEKWDGKWRLVIFDIPEEKRLARSVLQRKLKELGFWQLQKSVYMHPYPCEDEIEFIRSVYNVRQYVNILLVEKIENSQNFIKLFDL